MQNDAVLLADANHGGGRFDGLEILACLGRTAHFVISRGGVNRQPEMGVQVRVDLVVEHQRHLNRTIWMPPSHLIVNPSIGFIEGQRDLLVVGHHQAAVIDGAA